LGEAEAEVDPTVFLQGEQTRVPNGAGQLTIQDDPPAEAMCGLVLLIFAQPSLGLLNRSIRTSRGEAHDDSVAEPRERRLGVT